MRGGKRLPRLLSRRSCSSPGPWVFTIHETQDGRQYISSENQSRWLPAGPAKMQTTVFRDAQKISRASPTAPNPSTVWTFSNPAIQPRLLAQQSHQRHRPHPPTPRLSRRRPAGLLLWMPRYRRCQEWPQLSRSVTRLRLGQV